MIFTELPEGCECVELANSSSELGQTRLALVGELLGASEARSAALLAGAYELSDTLAHELAAEGIVLAAGGELPALSPRTWLDLPCSESVPSFLAGPHAGRLRGVLLRADEARAFRAFLVRNGAGERATAGELLGLARHFFFRAPIRVVLAAGAGSG